jgi:hypothetical protein
MARSNEELYKSIYEYTKNWTCKRKIVYPSLIRSVYYVYDFKTVRKVKYDEFDGRPAEFIAGVDGADYRQDTKLATLPYIGISLKMLHPDYHPPSFIVDRGTFPMSGLYYVQNLREIPIIYAQKTGTAKEFPGGWDARHSIVEDPLNLLKDYRIIHKNLFPEYLFGRFYKGLDVLNNDMYHYLAWLCQLTENTVTREQIRFQRHEIDRQLILNKLKNDLANRGLNDYEVPRIQEHNLEERIKSMKIKGEDNTVWGARLITELTAHLGFIRDNKDVIQELVEQNNPLAKAEKEVLISGLKAETKSEAKLDFNQVSSRVNPVIRSEKAIESAVTGQPAVKQKKESHEFGYMSEVFSGGVAFPEMPNEPTNSYEWPMPLSSYPIDQRNKVTMEQRIADNKASIDRRRTSNKITIDDDDEISPDEAKEIYEIDEWIAQPVPRSAVNRRLTVESKPKEVKSFVMPGKKVSRDSKEGTSSGIVVTQTSVTTTDSKPQQKEVILHLKKMLGPRDEDIMKKRQKGLMSEDEPKKLESSTVEDDADEPFASGYWPDPIHDPRKKGKERDNLLAQTRTSPSKDFDKAYGEIIELMLDGQTLENALRIVDKKNMTIENVLAELIHHPYLAGKLTFTDK